MTVTYGFYDSLSGDRKYNADQMSRIFDGILTDGVFQSIGTAMIVTSATGMSVNVGIGRAWFNHTWTYNDAVLTVTIPTSETVLNRIDTVVVEVNTDLGVRANSIKVIKGTPGSVPVAPTLSNTTTLKQYGLADIYVAANVTSINAGNITNRVGTTGTPFVTGIITTIDATTLFAKFQNDFNAWFNALVNQLSGSQVTNLQNQINSLVGITNSGWIPIISTLSHVSVDGATGVVNANADVTGFIQKGTRLKYDQIQALTAYWNLDGNSNSQVGSFNGTDTDITYAAGKFGNAAGFNGTTSKIVLTDNASLKPTGDFTFGAWIKLNSQAGVNQRIFQTYSANTNIAGIQISAMPTNLGVVIGKNTGTLSGVDYNQFVGNLLIVDGSWHYVVVTLRGNHLQTYVDGVLDISTFVISPPSYASTNYVRFGAGTNIGVDVTPLNGQIDDPFLINGYALDESTIKAKFLAQTAQGIGNITINKKAIVTYVGPYFAGSTPITFWGGTDFNLVNATISNPYYSYDKAPFGFNINPDKWVVGFKLLVTASKSGSAINTFYYTEMGSINIALPIGIWAVRWLGTLGGQVASGTTVSVYATVSASQSAESDPDMSAYISTQFPNSATPIVLWGTAFREKIVSVLVKTPLYFIVKNVTGTQDIFVGGGGQPTILKATLAYL